MPNIDLGQLFFLFIIITSLWPMITRYLTERGRTDAIRHLEKKRGSRVITLIHRQEALSFLGLAFARYINIEDSEQPPADGCFDLTARRVIIGDKP